MPLGRLLQRRWAIILGVVGHYSVLMVYHTITIYGLSLVNGAVSAVAANPNATTMAGTRTVRHDGVTTTPSELTTITETIVFGPSTAAYTSDSPEVYVTTTCVLTRSILRGICLYINAMLVGAGSST